MMAERIEGSLLVTFTCQCGGRIQALPSAEVRCKCGRMMAAEGTGCKGTRNERLHFEQSEALDDDPAPHSVRGRIASCWPSVRMCCSPPCWK